jgi:hypothetical protein
MLVAMPTAMPCEPFTSRFGARAVVVGAPRHRALPQLAEQLERDRAEARFGVAHGRGGVAVERAEVAVAFDEGGAHDPVLRHAHHRVVDRDVAVRVVLAHHVADDRGALAELGVGPEAQIVVHRVQDAALHGLEAVAHVG